MEVLFIIIGILAGAASVLLGIGGGIILVPALIAVGLSSPQAAAISSICIVPIALFGLIRLRKMPPVSKEALAYAGVGAIGGGVAGSYAAHYIPADWHQFIVIVSYLFLAGATLLPAKKSQRSPHDSEYGFLGITGGAFAGVLGVGGGIIIVPLLERAYGHEIHDATHISLAIIVISLVPAAASHLAIGNIPLEVTALLLAGGIVGAATGMGLRSTNTTVGIRTILGIVLLTSAFLMLIT